MQDTYYKITVTSIDTQTATFKVKRISDEIGHPECSPDFTVQILIESWDLLRKRQYDRFEGDGDTLEKLHKGAMETEAYGEYSMFYDYLYGSTVPLEDDEYELLTVEDETELKQNIAALEEKLGFTIATWGKNESMFYVVSNPSQSSFKLESQEVVENETEIDRGVDDDDNDYLIYTCSVYEDYYFDHLSEGLSWESTRFPL